MIFYFSGTGNSKWIAEQIAKAQNEVLVFMPNAIRDGIEEFVLADDEKVGFVFPVYSWGPPLSVLRFLDWITLSNYHSQYVFFVCSCGYDTGLTEELFRRALSRKGMECNAGFSVAMPNNYVLLPGFDVDKKELEKKKLDEAVGRVEEINDSITGKKIGFHCNEGSFPWFKTKVLNPLFNRFMTSAKPFYATDDCIGCKRCERICPVGNVVMIGWRPVWGMDCTSCLACYHVCPKHAVQYGRRTKRKGQYLNPNVSISHEAAAQ